MYSLFILVNLLLVKKIAAAFLLALFKCTVTVKRKTLTMRDTAEICLLGSFTPERGVVSFGGLRHATRADG